MVPMGGGCIHCNRNLTQNNESRYVVGVDLIAIWKEIQWCVLYNYQSVCKDRVMIHITQISGLHNRTVWIESGDEVSRN